ncbi:hypothetical protein LCD52_13180 [Rossellomorea vietnamensis]|uniref:hypothetical protein n=1 Tax=Rossellomorea vietnamensis TaxID=218284 RepID=UPI001CCCA650|nr:hypothetical protein [Rossellomorea vietnamensis]MCA0149747.1 hypothetical protein [Rossellomorea vietnamensis]
MFLTPDDIGELILLVIGSVLAIQFAYGCTILLLERTMLDFYDLSESTTGLSERSYFYLHFLFREFSRLFFTLSSH